MGVDVDADVDAEDDAEDDADIDDDDDDDDDDSDAAAKKSVFSVGRQLPPLGRLFYKLNFY